MSHRLLLSVIAAATLAFTGSANAAHVFQASMNGASEVPPNASPATGFATVDVTGTLMTVDLTYSGLVGGNPAAAHIHCCIAPGSSVGVAVGFPSFPTTTSGTYTHVFDLSQSSTYTSGFLNNFGGGTAAGAMAALLAGLNAGQAYTNIHNAAWPAGEIRGLLTGVPEPSSWALMIVGVGLAGLGLRRRRAHA
jgi:hypothetical protein